MNGSQTNNTTNNKQWSEWNDSIIKNKIRIGVRPPQPMLIPVDNNNVMYSFLDVNDMTTQENIGILRGINMKREPYAQVELITKYGNLNSRLGTSLGR
jgi:hypothetical protein